MEPNNGNTYRFTALGTLECEFKPEQSSIFVTKSGFTVELWQKSPLDVIFLGRSVTNNDGEFSINFDVQGAKDYLIDGEIKDVFLKIYFRGVLIAGANPYSGRLISSTRPFRDIVLSEGKNDLSTLQLDVTSFEFPFDANYTDENPNEPKQSWDLMFGAKFSNGVSIPAGYKFEFSVGFQNYPDVVHSSIQFSSKEEFVKLSLPELPSVPEPTEGDHVIKVKINEPVNSDSSNFYLKITDGTNDYYTLITDLVIHNDKISVFDGDSTYYEVDDNIEITYSGTVIIINEEGTIFRSNPAHGRFANVGTLTFYQIEFPEELDVVSNGIYQTNGNTGTITSGILGESSTPFEDAWATLENPSPAEVLVNAQIFEPGSETPMSNANIKGIPGSKKILQLTADGTPPVNADDGPTLSEIETVSGTTFSTAFSDFLDTNNLDGLVLIKNAGPIEYLIGLPVGATNAEKELLQSHVDLYTINEEIGENQHLIDEGYKNLFDIANTPKNEFLDDVVSVDLAFYKAVEIHEVIVQNQKLVSNLLAARMSDYELKDPVFPNVEKSDFANTEFASLINKCECDDCKSGVSPFAYFVDLVKYGSRHIRKTGLDSYSPVNYSGFFSLLENYFIQPFGSLSIDCDTLHEQFCRVRLVTEVFEEYVSELGLPQPLLNQLENDRKRYLLLTYKTILGNAGTSYEELRDIVITQPLSDKEEKAEKWASKIGIPFEVPGSSVLTADRIWLTFDNSDPDHVLDGENLEEIFGFRNTQRDVLTTPPESLIAEWKQIHLRNLWRKEDFPFTSYSREHVDPTDENTIKENWLPIIDPDIIGRSDLTYLSLDFAKELLKHRKADTDSFLKKYISDASFLHRTSVDETNKILRVSGIDITTHVIENDKIFIEETSNVFEPFNLLNKSLIGIDTDVILKKSTPQVSQDPIFQPYGAEPVMRYKRQLSPSDVDNVSINGNELTINFNSNILKFVAPDTQTDLYAKVISVNSSGTEEYEVDGSNDITNVNINSESQVILMLNPSPTSSFYESGAEITFIYMVEVPLFTSLIPDPEVICNEMFTVNQSYDYLSPTPSGETSPFTYKVWDEPSSPWPSANASSNPPTNYGKLKALHQIVLAGNANNTQRAIITGNLYLDTASFTKMMEILISCEEYYKSMFTIAKPTETELYELTSIFRISAKHQLRKTWIIEEIKHDPNGGTDYIKLMLDGQYFWKALNEPESGEWNPSLQTIPEIVGDINKSNIPILDPELLKSEDLLRAPDVEPYRDLYFERKEDLELLRVDHLSWLNEVPFNVEGFKQILNHINTGDKNVDYDLMPEFEDLEDLIESFESTDPFSIDKAETVLWEAFGITGEDFGVILPIKRAYESEDPENMPSTKELKTAVRLLTTGYKRLQLYGDDSAGWIKEEVTGDFVINNVNPVINYNVDPVKYYNVLKMLMPSYRGSFNNRSEWQRTLAEWNRTPTIQPDIVPPENIKEIVNGGLVYGIWTARKSNTEGFEGVIESLFNNSLTPANLLTNFDMILAFLIRRTEEDVADIQTYLDYFLNLTELESEGEDIRPYLEQYGISISSYRLLENVYRIIKTAVDESTQLNLLDSEYTDVIDTTVAIHFQNVLSFKFIQEEFEEDIILSNDEFQNYKPSPVELSATLSDQHNKWRSPHSLRKAWKDKLETRINRSKNVREQWADVLIDTEEITMPMMRDALIEVLRNDCESFDSASERLAQKFFIETKDNCCVKHSRVSFAIETVQGFIFSLESGVYDDSLENFSISAPNFKREWEWLGSYATWRSAVFTYIFPENLLYPTLKRLQSPPFRELSQTIRNANRFSSDDACRAARKFQDHFEDLQHLKIICTSNAQAYSFIEDEFDCCGDMSDTQRVFTTFYFAQSEISGKSYWSEKPYDYKDESQHTFWMELPLKINVEILGVFPLAKDYDENHNPLDLALWLFYTYNEEGKFKMAYLKKDLITAGSTWDEETEIGLPDITTMENTMGLGPLTKSLSKITACQQSDDWDFPSFIFSYRNHSNNFEHFHVRYNFHEDGFDDQNLSTLIRFEKFYGQPVTAIKHTARLATQGLETVPAISVIFKDEIHSGYFGSDNDPKILYQPNASNFDSFVGCYQYSFETFSLICLERTNSGNVNSYKLVYYISGGDIIVLLPLWQLTNDNFIQNIRRIAPIYKQTQHIRGFAVEAYSDEIAVGTMLDLKVDQGSLSSSGEFGLSIEKESLVSVHSADCIENFDLRTQDIKNHIRANLSAPEGNPVGDFIRTDKVKAYLYEAYYFVPMLIALDQQQRGQFEEALSWYRSVYDYTNNINNKRKIFYGLVLEESIANVYQRPANWLLDPLNPHLIAETRANAYTKYTLMNIAQCMVAYADREFTMDTIETVPRARKLYTEALSLLKVKELDKKPSACRNLAYACLEKEVVLPSSGYWDNFFSQLQEKISQYNDIELIETTVNYVENIFGNGELTIEQKFSAAFDYVNTNTPSPATPISTTELLNGFGQQMNDAYRFLTAGIDTQSYNKAVSEKVGITVGEISKIAPEELYSTEILEKISWLGQPEKANDEPFDFTFINSSGIQKLDEEFAYDPLVPYELAYKANLAYTNANVMYHINIYPDSFVPIINYSFCLPENPVYDSLQLKANLELYKIHNCRNIAGMVRELDIFAAPTDSTTGVPIIGAGGNLVLPGVGNFTPSQYRFRVLIERAKQLVSQAQQLESQFLATLEKENAERYSLMKARQDLQTAKATIKLQNLRVRQANNELDLAELQLDKVEFSFDHFEDLIDTGLIGFEVASLSLLTAATVAQAVATAGFYAAAAGSTLSLKYAEALAKTAQGTASLAQTLSMTSSIMSQMASFQRRQQEWAYQKELANFDIQLSNQQIKIAEDNIRIVSQERKISEMNAGHAEDTLEFLKTKFTNVELYRWMGNILERSYSYMLSLATAVARTAERQYYFEQQEQAGPFILDDYWEVQETGAPTQGGSTDRRGLTGSVRLLQDITRLDQFAFENTKRKLQITKTVSLAQLFPEEFQSFRETGVFNFELTNQMFDYDYPGQYLRLIKGMKVAVIGLTPVNDGIKAMLTAGSTSYTVIEANNTFQRVPIRRLENEEIALSSPLSNNGLFELQPTQQEFLNPFEGMGIESRWEFKMPKYSNRMDYNQIADILVEIDYSALDNFQYRYQVLQENDNRYDFNRGFSFKNDFPDQWYELAEAQDGPSLFGVEFEIRRDSFPQGLDNIQLDGSDLLLHFVREDGFTDEIVIADFNIADAESEMPGETLNGTFRAQTLTTDLNGSPFVRLRLYFDNDLPYNRELFSEEKIQDILLLMSCKAELPNYPL